MIKLFLFIYIILFFSSFSLNAKVVNISGVVCGSEVRSSDKVIVSNFMKNNPKYNVTLQAVPWLTCQDHVIDLAIQGNPVSFAYIGSRTLPFLFKNDYIVPVKISEERKQYYTNDILKTVYYGGNYLGYPHAFSTKVLFVNCNILKKAGIKCRQPKTWSELYEIAKTVKNKTGIAGIGLAAKDFDNTTHQFLNFLYSNGGQIIDPNTNKITLNNKKNLETLKFYSKLSKVSQKNPLAYERSQLTSLFNNKEIAMYVNGSWGKGQHSNISDAQIFEIPPGPSVLDKNSSGSLMITDSIVVFKNTGHEEVAMNIAQKLTSFNNQFDLDSSWGLTPIYNYKKIGITNKYENDYWKKFTQASLSGGPEPLFVDYKSFQYTMNIMIQESILGNDSLQNLLTKADKELEKFKLSNNFFLANLNSDNLIDKNNKILIKDTDEEIRLTELKSFLDTGLITQEEYNYKRNEILGLPNNKKETIKKVIVSNDVIAPVITVADSFEADSNLIAEIKGSVFDDNEIVQITIDGDPVNFINDRFAQKLFVKPGGQEILITAMDKFGNESSRTILLKRLDIVIAKNIFDSLNPTIMKSKINPSAVALIIGIEDYQYTFAAPFAKNDALAFNDFAHYSLGVPMQNIKLLTNDNAERISTLKSVQWLSKIVKENSSDVYVFFSGHGLASEDGEDLYLLPSDGDPELLEDSTLLRNQLFDRIAKLNPRSVTVFLDTCYSGATRSEEFLVAAKPIFIEAKEQDIPAKFTIFSASAGKETAKVLNEAEHGLFSYYMMKGLEGEADINSDRKITNGELITFINKNVSRQANQTPQLNGDPEQVLVSW